MVGAKIFHFGWPGSSHPERIWDYTWELLIATASDNCLALGIGLTAALTVALLRRWPRTQGTAFYAWTLICFLCVGYAMVSAYIFTFTRTPITRDLLRAAGSWADMKSSILPYVNRTVMTTLIGAPLGYLLLVYLSHRFIGLPRPAVVRLVAGVLTIAVLGQFAYSQDAQHIWTRRVDHRIALNSHWALFAAYVLREPDEKLNIPAGIPESYDDDFHPYRDRPGVTPASALPAAHAKHVILYVLESTSTQFLHLYGSPYPTTPNLDAEAAHGAVFDNIYSEVGMTPSALVGINSSNYARTIWNSNANYPDHPLHQPGILISEVLKSHGYRTLALTSSDFMFSHQRDFIEKRGFDQIMDKRDLAGGELTSWGKPDSVMVDHLLGWIDKDANHQQPFFALCWTNQTHHPYAMTPGATEQDMIGDFNPPPPAKRADINRYLNILVEEDRQLERLLTGLRQRGLADDTLVVITGDHGEGFNWPHESFGHGFRLYEENLHVPCVMLNSRLFATGRRLPAVGNHIDLAPSITDLLGITPAGTWQGHSLFDPARPDRAYYYGAFDDYLLGIRQGDWKYTFNATTGYGELYNLATDPHESTDVFAAHPEICKELRDRAGAWARHLDQYGPGVKP